MSAPLFIGDEITAAGFRLAGVRIRTPDESELPRMLDWAAENALLIYITAEYVALLDEERRNRLLTRLQPPAVVIPDIRSRTPVQDLATQLRAQLGVLE